MRTFDMRLTLITAVVRHRMGVRMRQQACYSLFRLRAQAATLAQALHSLHMCTFCSVVAAFRHAARRRVLITAVATQLDLGGGLLQAEQWVQPSVHFG